VCVCECVCDLVRETESVLYNIWKSDRQRECVCVWLWKWESVCVSMVQKSDNNLLPLHSAVVREAADEVDMSIARGGREGKW
jgi:hypothetical protein